MRRDRRVIPGPFFLVYPLRRDEWRADLMVYQARAASGIRWLREQSMVVRASAPLKPGFTLYAPVEAESRTALLERLERDYPGAPILELPRP